MHLSSTRAVARAAALLALVSVAACSDSPLSPLGPTSPDFARGGGGKPPKPPQPTPVHDPILFVHGWNASSSTWATMVSRFKADGWTDAQLVNWSYNYRQSNATTAAQIQQKVDSILNATGATKVDIITHSMGPLSARYYIRNLGGDAKVDALTNAADRASLSLKMIDAPKPDPAFRHDLLIVRTDQHVAWRGNAAPTDCDALIARLMGRA